MKLASLNAATKGRTRTDGAGPFAELPIDDVYPNPDQPRQHFGEESLQELAESIDRHGLMQPITVTKSSFDDGEYVIIGGERRWRAHKLLGRTTIQAYIKAAGYTSMQELALVENIHRDDLTDMEKAIYIKTLADSGDYPRRKDLAAAIGKSESYVSKAIGIAERIDPRIHAHIEESQEHVSMERLQELSTIKDPDQQVALYEREATRDQIRAAKRPKLSRAKEKEVISSIRLEEVESLHELPIFALAKPGTRFKITIEEIT